MKRNPRQAISGYGNYVSIQWSDDDFVVYGKGGPRVPSTDSVFSAPNREHLAAYYGGRALKAASRREPRNAASFARDAAHHALELVGRDLVRGRGGCDPLSCRRPGHRHENSTTASYTGFCECGLI